MKILIIGGNRFFGKHLAEKLVEANHSVTLLNRGKLDDGLEDRVNRLVADRSDAKALKNAVGSLKWDLVFDQACYVVDGARAAIEIFSGKVGRYIFTSTESVYDYGFDQLESNFNPFTFKIGAPSKLGENYQLGKRQCEAAFAGSDLNVAMARFSLVVGTDDYTGRLKWHIDRIRSGQAIHFPNIDAKSDFIRADQAAEALMRIGMHTFTGPVNCTTPGSIALRDLVSMIEGVVDKKAVLSASGEPSPYGGDDTKTMNTSLLATLGCKFAPSTQWMEGLISQIADGTI